MEFAQSLLLATVSNPETFNLLLMIVLAVGGIALRKIPSTYINEKQKEKIELILESVSYDALPITNELKKLNGGDVPPDEGKKIFETVKAKAINIAQAKGIKVSEVLAPEMVNYMLQKAFEKIKGTKALPAGTASLLPLLLLLVSGCATYPDGFENVQPETVTAVAEALQEFRSDPVIVGAAKVAATTYFSDRLHQIDRSAAAAHAIKAASDWAAAQNIQLSHYLAAKLKVDQLTEGDVLIGLLKWAIEKGKVDG